MAKSSQAGVPKGGTGCGKCGGHNTNRMRRHGKRDAIVCLTCGHHWERCEAYCKGYRLIVERGKDPMIIGCPDCGVPDRIARRWPEAWRAMCEKLGETKALEVYAFAPASPAPVE